ncbi:MAG TPA: hypothetical protein IAC36_08845 [Candidatus Aphodomonas merdavium]|nr:hypothetical protein [Candidatus Aphodomonas merdavium]
MICQRPIKSLSDLMDGSVEERFNAELDKVWQNVFDPNTDPKKTRTLTLKVKIIPNERRDSCDFRVNVTSSLVSYTDMSQTVMLSVGADGTIMATERTGQVPGQLDIDGNETPIPQTIAFGRLREVEQ